MSEFAEEEPKDEQLPEQEAEKTPEALFTEHVQDIRENGDAIDAQKRLSIRSAITVGIAVGVETGALAGEMLDVNPSVNAGLLTIAGLWGVSKLLRHPRQKAEGQRRYNRDTQEAIGEEYELYTYESEDGEGVAMRWYGSLDEDGNPTNENLLQHLDRVNTLAEEAGINSLIVGDDLVQAMDLQNADLDAHGSMFDFLLGSKHRYSGRKPKEDHIHIRSPKQWQTTIEDEETVEKSRLDTLLDDLTAYRPDHPLSTINQQFGGKDSDVRSAHLLRTARLGVERQLDGASSSRTEYGARVKHHSTGTITANQQVHTYSDGNYEETTGLDTALGTSDEKLQQAVQNGQDNPQAAIRALEVLVYKQLKNDKTSEDEYQAAEQAAALTDRQAPYQPSFIGLKSQVAKEDQVSLRGQHFSRIGIGVLPAAAAYAISMIGVVGMSGHYHDKVSDIQTELNGESGAYVTSHDPKVQERLGPLQLWSNVENGLMAVGQPLNRGPDLNSIPHVATPVDLNVSRASKVDGSVGDVSRNTTNSPVWLVKASGASAKGYWAQDVSEQFSASVSYNGGVSDLSWTPSNYTTYNSHKLDLPTAAPEHTDKSLQINRELGPNDSNMISIPVREGTKPAAISMDGKPTELYLNQNGTYTVSIDPSEKSTHNPSLQYTLVESDDAPKPKATHPSTLNLNSMKLNSGAIDEVWSKRIPNLPPSNGDPAIDRQRSEMIADYMQQTWSYKLEPWKNMDKSGISDLSQLEEKTASAEAANCNVAATMLALENQNINTVSGFSNSGSDNLTFHESHMWATDASGERIDGTPSKGMSAEDEAFFKDPEQQASEKQQDAKLWMYGGLALFLGGAALWRRRDIEKGVHYAEAKLVTYGENRLSALDHDHLALAQALMEQANFGRAINLGQARARADQAQGTPREIVDRMTDRQSGLATKHAQQSLASLAKGTTDEQDRTALQASSHTAKRAHRIARHRH